MPPNLPKQRGSTPKPNKTAGPQQQQAPKTNKAAQQNPSTPSKPPSGPNAGRGKSLSDPESPSKTKVAGTPRKDAKTTKRDVDALLEHFPPPQPGKKGPRGNFTGGTGDPALDMQLARQHSQQQQSYSLSSSSSSLNVPPGYTGGTGDPVRDRELQLQREQQQQQQQRGGDRYHASSFNGASGYAPRTGDPALDAQLARQHAQSFNTTAVDSRHGTPTKRAGGNKQMQQAQPQGAAGGKEGKFDHFYAAGTWTNSPAASSLPIPAFKRETGTPKPSPDGVTSMSGSVSDGFSPEWSDRRPGPRSDEHSNPFLTPSAVNSTQQGIFSMDPEPRSSAVAPSDVSEAERLEKSRKLMSLLGQAPVAAPPPTPVSAPTATSSRHPILEMFERQAQSSSPGPKPVAQYPVQPPVLLQQPPPPPYPQQQQRQSLGPVLVPLQQAPQVQKDPSLEDATGMLKSMLNIG